MKRVPSASPTLEQFSKYQKAWEWFNDELFGGTLQPCLLNFSRHRGAKGFFTSHRWQKDGEAIHEISLNPDMLNEPLEETMSTLVHEMAHQWQEDHGTPSRGNYHNREWAEKMVEVGLIPSDTGQPGGKPTGQKMSDYIDPDGKFIKVLRQMPKEYILPWTSGGAESDAEPKPPRPKKIKFACPECETNIWAEAEDLNATCEDCGETFLNPDD